MHKKCLTFIFSSKGNGIHTFTTVKEQVNMILNIWYTISYTHNTNDNINTALSTSEIYNNLKIMHK